MVGRSEEVKHQVIVIIVVVTVRHEGQVQEKAGDVILQGEQEALQSILTRGEKVPERHTLHQVQVPVGIPTPPTATRLGVRLGAVRIHVQIETLLVERTVSSPLIKILAWLSPGKEN